MTAKLAIEGVGKSFNGKSVLEEINLQVQPGEIVCILGHSGCGKSTLLNMVAGFLQPDYGRIAVDGRKVDGPSKERGVVFQDHALFPWFTVLDNIAFGPKVQGASKKSAREKAEKYLKLVGLESYASHHPHELSGGMKQRVGIARALASEPEMLLMDEPFGALDILTRDTMQTELLLICKKVNATVLFVTHSISEALHLGDRVIVMKHGAIAASYELDMPKPRTYGHPRFAELMGELEEVLREGQEARGA